MKSKHDRKLEAAEKTERAAAQALEKARTAAGKAEGVQRAIAQDARTKADASGDPADLRGAREEEATLQDVENFHAQKVEGALVVWSEASKEVAGAQTAAHYHRACELGDSAKSKSRDGLSQFRQNVFSKFFEAQADEKSRDEELVCGAITCGTEHRDSANEAMTESFGKRPELAAHLQAAIGAQGAEQRRDAIRTLYRRASSFLDSPLAAAEEAILERILAESRGLKRLARSTSNSKPVNVAPISSSEARAKRLARDKGER